MTTCPKCKYARKPTDHKVPEWQCPSCGIAYAKFEARQATDMSVKRASLPPATVSAAPMSATALFFILAGLLAVGYVGYQRYLAPKGEAAESSSVLEAASGSLPPVLLMSAEASENLPQLSPERVVLFSAAWCPHCKTVRALLQRQGVRFAEFDIERDERAAAYQKENLPVMGFPVTIIGSRIVMGDDEGQILAALKTL